MLDTDSPTGFKGQPENHQDQLSTAVLFQMEAEGVGRINADGTPSDPDQWLFLTRGETDLIAEDWTLELWQEWQAAKPDFLIRKAKDNDFRYVAPPAIAEGYDFDDPREQQMIAEIKARTPHALQFDLKPISPTTLAQYRDNPTAAKNALAKAWRAKYRGCQSERVQGALNIFFDTSHDDDGEMMFLYPREPTNIFEPKEVLKGMNNPAFTELVKFAHQCRIAYEAIDTGGVHNLIEPPDDPDPVRGPSFLGDVVAPSLPDIYPGVVPTGLTLIHGLPDTFKSTWLHKLGLCIADDAAQFDGMDIAHGRVLYVTLDSGASRAEVMPRVRAIHEHLHLNVEDRFVLTDDLLFLNEPTSVRDFIDRYKPHGPYRALMIDALFNAVNGSLSEANLRAALQGVKMLRRESSQTQS